MKTVLSCLLAVILSAISMAGCGAGRNAGREDVQRLSQVEVYSADGNLLGTVTDEDTLLRFSGLHYTDISSIWQTAICGGLPIGKRGKQS